MESINKEAVVQAIIEKFDIDQEENLNIQTGLLDGYEKPGKIILKGHESEGYTPDVLLESPDTLEIFEVEMGKRYHPEKWRLFSLFSNKRKGNFHIVTPEDQLQQLRVFLDKNNIKAKILYFS